MVSQRELGGVPPAAGLELMEYLRTSGSTLSMSEALSHAIKLWIATRREAAEPALGYQWKCLFMPSGTRLRMRHDEQSFHADVVGDRLLYKGQAVSPRQFTMMVAGEGRNAWRDVWVRMHGEHNWVQAIHLRRALEQRPVAPSPLEEMAAAARTMSAALQTTLTLVEQVHLKSTLKTEQRIPKRRRLEDMLPDE